MQKRPLLSKGLTVALATVGLSLSGGNLLVNPGFEKPDAKGGAEGWRANRKYSFRNGEGEKGTRALVWENDDPKAYSVPGQTFLAKTGRVYMATCRARGKVSEQGAKLCIEWQDEKGKWLGGAYSDALKGEFDWSELRVRTPPLPARAKRITVSPFAAKEAVGRVAFDDVTCELVNVPLVGSLCSSVYRNTWAEGDCDTITFAVPLNLGANDLSEDQCQGLFALPRKDGKRFSVAARLENGGATAQVPAGLLGSGEVSFKLFAASRAGCAAEAKLDFKRIASHPAAGARIDPRGRLIVDGRPFFPLGMYFGGVTTNDLDELKRGPFNCIMPYNRLSQAQLDACHARGIKVAYSVKDCYHFILRGRDGISDAAAADRRCARRVNELKDHPALLAWYVNDESGVEYLPYLSARQRLLETLDPRHPTWMVVWQVKQMRDFLPTFDVCGSDPYPHDDYKRWHDPHSWPRQQAEGTFGLRPIWQAVQVHDAGAYTKDRDKATKTHVTTLEEMRSMSWQALAGGANGIFFYSFFDLKRMDWKTPFAEGFARVCTVAEELKRFEDVFLADETPPALEIVGNDIGARAWKRDGRTYVAVVNLRHTGAQGEVNVAGEYGEPVVLLGTAPASVPRGVKVDLPGFGVSFFELPRRSK